MKINNITLLDLRRMNSKEGLILQGCGGETQEWVDGINEMLTDKGILLDNTKFENVSVFKSDGVTCILYPFEDVHLDIGKLAMWRLPLLAITDRFSPPVLKKLLISSASFPYCRQIYGDCF